MIRLKRKNIPGLLQQTLHAEARKVEPPSRQQLWAKLQQRPEFAAARKNAEQLFPQPDVQKLEKAKGTGSGLYGFYRRRPGLAGLIAAGLLLVVFLSRLAPFQLVPLMKQSDALPQAEIALPEKSRPDSMQAGDGGENVILSARKMGTAADGRAAAGGKAPPESVRVSLRSHLEEAAAAAGGEAVPARDTHLGPAQGVSPAQNGEEIQPAKESQSAAEVQPAAEEQAAKENRQSPAAFSMQAGETPAPEAPLPESAPRDPQLNRSLRAVPGEQIFEEQIFTEEKPFLLALKEARQLTAEEVWQVKILPEKIRFAEGRILRTAETLRQVEQSFAGEGAGEGFALTQRFAMEELNGDTNAGPPSAPGEAGKAKAEADADLSPGPGEASGDANAGQEDSPGETKTGENADLPMAKGPTQPMQVGPYRGYLQRTSPEHCTLTWLQEKSTVTLSGQLTDEALYQVLAALESPA